MDLLGGADMEFVRRMQSGVPMTAADFGAFIRRTEKKIPTKVRAEELMLSINSQILENIELSRTQRRTRADWQSLYKLSRNGLRISRLFGTDQQTQYFKVLFATTARYLRGRV